MGTQVDASLGLAPETVYGTPAVVTRFYESPVKMKYTPVKVQGKGMQPTKRVQRLNRNTLSHIEVTGEMELEIPTRGFGALLEAVMGVVTNTLTKAGTTSYQQVHTLATTDPVKSYTLQGVLPTLGGGAGNPHTYSGCVADGMTIEAKEGEILTAKIDWLGRDMSTAITAAAASYPLADLFTFVHGSIRLQGAITPPTATALAVSTASAAGNIAEVSVSIKNNLDTGGYNLGGAGKRSRKNELGGQTSVSGKMKAEYTDNTLRDAYVNQTPVSILLEFQVTGAGNAIGIEGASTVVYPTLQIVLPAVLLEGDVPASNGGEPIAIDIPFSVFDNGTGILPIYVVYRTLDTTP